VHMFLLSGFLEALKVADSGWGFLSLSLSLPLSLSLRVCFFCVWYFWRVVQWGRGKMEMEMEMEMEIYRGESFFVERCWLVGLGYKERDIVV
jgi:hypothetical protein